jgi:long-chain acyl-CoA synthetase
MNEDIPTPWYKFWPEYVPKHIDYQEISLGDLLRNSAKRFPDSQAIYFEGFRLTYAELDTLVDQFATGLSKLGIKKGDIVGIDLPNVPQFVIAFYALQRLGATANPIIPLHRFVEIAHQINDSNSIALIILDVLYEEHLHGKELSKMPTLKHIILTGVGEFLPKIKAVLGKALGKVPRMKKWPTKVGNIDFVPFQEILSSGEPINLPEIKINPKKDIATLIYTGGTTGIPKGVMLTHFNMSTNAEQGLAWIENQLPETKELHGKGGAGLVVPFAHVFGISTGMNLGISVGYKLILFAQPPEKKSKILDLLMKEKATYIPGVPTLWNLINQDPDSSKFKGKLTTLKACVSGGASLPEEVKKKFEDITGALIIEGYGLSETSPNLCCGPFYNYKVNTVGFPLSDTYVKIVDIDEGKKLVPQCPDDESTNNPEYFGEICACGPQITPGYLGKKEESEFALRKDSQGRTWLYTADIGCIDKDGYVMIKDRKRDMIKYKGHGVFPAEVENLMYQNDAIKEVGVIGIPHPDGTGETIKAYVSIKEEYKGKITKEELMGWCKDNISPYKYPRIIEIIDELPKTLVGKILRRELRKMED